MNTHWVRYLDCSYPCSFEIFKDIRKAWNTYCYRTGKDKPVWPSFILSYDSSEGSGGLLLRSSVNERKLKSDILAFNKLLQEYNVQLNGSYVYFVYLKDAFYKVSFPGKKRFFGKKCKLEAY